MPQSLLRFVALLAPCALSPLLGACHDDEPDRPSNSGPVFPVFGADGGPAPGLADGGAGGAGFEAGPPPGSADALRAENHARGLEIGPRTNRHGGGDPFDLGAAVSAISSAFG